MATWNEEQKAAWQQRKNAERIRAQERREQARKAQFGALTPEQRRAEAEQAVRDIWG